jgi:uncharacterized membrane protein
MKTEKQDLIELFVILVLGCILGFAAGVSSGNRFAENQAIKAGVAYYNPTNAQFTYKTLEK